MSGPPYVASQNLDGLRLAEYAAATALPEEFLRELGLVDADWYGTPAVAIPYRDQDGREIAVRFRLSLNGDDRFRWPPGTKAKGKVYGLDRWSLAAAAGRGAHARRAGLAGGPVARDSVLRAVGRRRRHSTRPG